MSTHARRQLFAAIVTTGCCLAFTVAGQPISAQAASSTVDTRAVPGLTRVEATNSDQGLHKTAFANCPGNTVTLGGGGWANDSGGSAVMLTALVPSRFHFAASASAPPGFPWFFSVTAYAICGPAPAGLEYITQRGAASSVTFKQTTVACPAGKRVLSSGGAVGGASPSLLEPARVGLHLVRPDGPLTIGRATAREISAGYSGFWTLDAHAVCVFPIPGQQNAARVTNGTLAAVACPTGTQAHGAGGGGAIFDVGPQFLQSVVPNSALTIVTATMTSAPPAHIGMVAQATCAN